LDRLGFNLETSLVFIHGFLGLPSDWNSLLPNIRSDSVYCFDLNRDLHISEMSFQAWPQAFKNWLRAQKVSRPVQVIGYSMGGRLALPLLEQQIIQSAVMLSGHMGLPEMALKERTDRRLSNQMWSEKFLHQPWSQTLNEWNQQDVFLQSIHEPHRQEENYDRTKLSAMLTGFSLSEQKDYSSLLKTDKIFYLVGEKDNKYYELATKFKKDYSQAKIEVIPSCGHRVLFDQPQAASDRINQFINKI
jgi:2-succinyl-6-hydroxy-2,4-cyclohexadiene-1-carboxylate synthase